MRYAKSNNVVNEETSNIIEAIRDRYQDIRKNLSRLTSVRGYTEQVSAIHEDAYEATDDKVTELRNMFTAKTFDESLDLLHRHSFSLKIKNTPLLKAILW